MNSKARKKHLKQFNEKVYNWACGFVEFGDEELKTIKEYLWSDEFYKKVCGIADKHQNQNDINAEITLFVSDKFSEMLPKAEHKLALKNILILNNIKTT